MYYEAVGGVLERVVCRKAQKGSDIYPGSCVLLKNVRRRQSRWKENEQFEQRHRGEQLLLCLRK